MAVQSSKSGVSIRRGFWLGILALAILLVCRSQSSAGQLIPLSMEELSAVADDVVHVKVVDTSSEWYNGKIITRNSLQVMGSLKGVRGRSANMELVTLGGRRGKLTASDPGAPKLKKGEEAILFLRAPIDHLPADRTENDYNLESPLIQSPQIIGGFQGKFQVVRKMVQHETNGRTVEREEVKVMRSVLGRTISFEDAPTIENFSSAVRELTDENSRIARVEKNIPTVGMTSVPVENSRASILRMFDPLPARAQLPPQRYVPEEKPEVAGKEEAPTEETVEPAEDTSPAPGIRIKQ